VEKIRELHTSQGTCGGNGETTSGREDGNSPAYMLVDVQGLDNLKRVESVDCCLDHDFANSKARFSLEMY